MIDLNNKEAISAIDKSDSYFSISNLAKQCKQAWTDTQTLELPNEYKTAQNICLCGMGGSAYAAYFIKALFSSSLNVPFELVNGYDIPAYINNKSLVLLSSYSGSTEETLSCAKQALSKQTKVTAVTSGLRLADFVKQNNLPAYIFNPLYNPSSQPRLGQGYMIFGHLGLLAKLGFIPLSTEKVNEAIGFLESKNSEIDDLGKEISQKLVEKIPVIVAAEHLSANAHTIRNQFNETSKNFSTYSLVSELNHHLMEGLVHPTKRILSFLVFRSFLYSSVIQKRISLTEEVLHKNNVDVLSATIQGNNKLQQVLYALSLGGYITFYLAILYKQDPSLVPWVDYFKEKLAR
ncbi:MAG: SIS domain-containing protein [Candidatus Levyibacteriota bacterium]|nr:MAG: SIS domain-containing protein [Candidatus Levybacteria bacterium]